MTAVSSRVGIVVDALRPDIDLDIIKGQKEPYYEGWHDSRGFKPAPALIYTWKEKAKSSVETLLHPFATGAKDAREVRACSERVGHGAVVVTVTGHRPNTTDYILIAGESGECAGRGYECKGDLAFVRTSGDQMVAAGMVNGTSLKGSREVFALETPASAWGRLQADGTWQSSEKH